MAGSDSSSGLIGKTIGRFKVIEEVGRGGMATVYKAHQPSIDRFVALKVLPTQFAHDPNFLQRFEREAKAIAALEHPHILPLYDFGTQEGFTYMAMRYIKGGDLSNLMGGQISNEHIAQIISDIARALDYAHKNGVIHRDIKPSNILIDSNGEALLTDFGIAKVADSKLTGTDMILGTPDYMAPEQLDGIADARSDIYALGVVMFELLTGQPPYQAATPLATALKHMNEALPSPRSLNPNIEEPLEQVITQAMAKEPDERYQTAAEMADALKAALQQIASSAPTLSSPVSPTRQKSRAQQPGATSNNMLWIGGGIAAIILILIIGSVVIFSGPTAATGQNSPAASPQPGPQNDTQAAAPTKEASSDLGGLLEGELLLRETFDSNERGWFALEFEDEFGFYQAKLVNGRYRLSRQATEYLFIKEEPENTGEFDNFVASVEATPAQESNLFSYGLTFRSNADGFYYTFDIFNDGHFSVRLRTTGGWQTLVENTATAALNQTGPNQLVVEANGPTLRFFINDQQVATVEDTTLQSGKVGLFIEVDAGQNGTVEFDNLRILTLNNR